MMSFKGYLKDLALVGVPMAREQPTLGCSGNNFCNMLNPSINVCVGCKYVGIDTI